MKTHPASSFPTADAVRRWISGRRIEGFDDAALTVSTLAGDGSQRVFFRIVAGAHRAVVVSDPGWRFTGDYAPLQRFLASKGLPVPDFFVEDAVNGFLMMEDLGDELLQHRLLAEPGDRLAWLRRAMTLLADLHGKTYPVPPGLPVTSRRFDAKKYRDELEFTQEHLHRGLLGLPAVADADRENVERFVTHLEDVDAWVFCHRDYHSRNVLVRDEVLELIDFQDARLGPVHYDVASLVYDPYVPLTPDERRALVAAYQEAVSRYPLARELDQTDFDRRLDAVGLQRLVKAAGSFASFFTRFGKGLHLAYLDPCLETAATLQAKVAPGLFPIATWRDRWKTHPEFRR
jgi:aminoglycoside/choline kinase family phosphotransferase